MKYLNLLDSLASKLAILSLTLMWIVTATLLNGETDQVLCGIYLNRMLIIFGTLLMISRTKPN